MAFPLPRLDANYETKENLSYKIPTHSGGDYGVYIGPNKELVIAYVDQKTGKPVEIKHGASFLPEDMDDVIKGALYQACAGLGRTQGRELIEILQYVASPQFQEDKAKLEEELAKGA